jgi:threonine 3-dehydrogenase
MLYGPDCLSATWQLMTAPRSQLTQTTYNVTALSFTPAELAAAIKKHLPHFEITYTPDFRDEIAKTWPISIDDSAARRDWGWEPKFDLDALAADMLQHLEARYSSSSNGSTSGQTQQQAAMAGGFAGFAVR